MPARPHPESTCPDLADLLLASEGELPKRRQAEVSFHLRACPTCREQLGNVGLAMREYEDAAPTPQAGSTDARERLSLFRSRLQDERRSTLARAIRLPIRGWLPVAAAVPVLVAALFFSSRYNAVVRAEELLTRAAAQEQSVEPGTIRRLQFQIRRVVARSPTGAVAPRRDGQGRGERDQWSFTREVATSPRVTNVSNAANDDSAELTRLLDASHFDSRDPLSIRSFRAWRDSLSQKTESVTAVGADALLLRTATSEGVLRSAELIVRRVDFRPLRQTLFFDGFGEVEIIEVSRWVSRAPLVAEGSALSPSPVAQAAPSLDALDEAEVDVRLALHNLGADLNPAIAITRSERAIEVRGRVDARSKPEIVKALDKIDAARVSLRTAPAMEPDFASSAPPIGESAEGTGPVSARPLARWLERTFGAGERSAAFVSALTTDSDKVHRRATAFVALSKRYPEQSVSHLSVAARRKLDALADAHYRDLLQGIETLDDRLAFFLGTATRPAPNRLAPRPWQASAVVIATHADRLDAAIRSVLREHDLPLPTEIGPGQAEPPALSNLREATNELWRQLSTAAPQT